MSKARLVVVTAIRRESADDPQSSPQSFEVAQFDLPRMEAGALISSLETLPSTLRIDGTSTADSIWIMRLRAVIGIDGRQSIMDVDLGPAGIRGDDAEAVRAFLRVLLGAAQYRDQWVIGLLTQPQPDY